MSGRRRASPWRALALATSSTSEPATEERNLAVHAENRARKIEAPPARSKARANVCDVVAIRFEQVNLRGVLRFGEEHSTQSNIPFGRIDVKIATLRLRNSHGQLAGYPMVDSIFSGHAAQHEESGRQKVV